MAAFVLGPARRHVVDRRYRVNSAGDKFIALGDPPASAIATPTTRQLSLEIVDDADAVLSVLGVPFTRRPVDTFSTGTANIVAAMRQKGFGGSSSPVPPAPTTAAIDKMRHCRCGSANPRDWPPGQHGFRGGFPV
jgi:hypothetical protein